MTDRDTGEWRVAETTQRERPVYLRWHLTYWCNFACDYCDQTHDRHQALYDLHELRPRLGDDFVRALSTRNSGHAFDNAKPDAWIAAFERLPHSAISILITGGEPFLDKKHFPDMLRGLTEIERVRSIRIDTNGSWSGAAYEGVDWRKIKLNLSFHPRSITLDHFKKHLAAKLEMGIGVAFVNFVMAPGQATEYPHVKQELERMGVVVNPGVYFGAEKPTEEGMALYRTYVPKFELDMKLGRFNPLGKPCFYPSVAIHLNPAGYSQVPCVGQTVHDFLYGDVPERAQSAVPCPRSSCGCLDMYGHLAASGRGRKLDSATEYAEQLRAFQNCGMGGRAAGDGTESGGDAA